MPTVRRKTRHRWNGLSPASRARPSDRTLWTVSVLGEGWVGVMVMVAVPSAAAGTVVDGPSLNV
jgi:hypothetical protein